MSEERRKRQQEREHQPRDIRKYFTWGAILILFAAAYYAGWHYKNHKYDHFAQCLAAKQAKMYGLYWCPHCQEQKQMFGQAFHYVPYVECAIKGSHELAPECKAAGVKLFPSWQFGMDSPKAGVLSLEDLSAKTGCSLP
ncbi:MAG TPA: hypothetical protein VMD99_09750 [Terriglobales bacterium]|nr:hypothetical protein [Terriglobales bacterium]